MPSLQFAAGVVIAIGGVFVVFGVLSGALCGGGQAFIDFGVAALLVGVGLAMLGALPVLGATIPMGILLIGAGWYLGQLVGCY